MRKFTLSMLASLAFLILAAATTYAASPGTNGQISFGLFNFEIGDTQIWVANPDGSHPVQITNAPSEVSDWSPDGTRLAFDFFDGQNLQIATANPDGTGFAQLTTQGNVFHAAPAWSPSGTQIAIESDGGNFPAGEGIYLMDASTGSLVLRLTANPYGFFDIKPRWSPDGRWLAFTRFKSARKYGITAIFLVKADGSGLRQLTPWGLDAGAPDWSPDGTKISFFSHSDLPAHSSIYTIHADGSELTLLVAASARGGFGDARWSPDGTKLILAGGTNIMGGGRPQLAGPGLWTINADGSNLTLVIPGFNFAPAWGTRPIQ